MAYTMLGGVLLFGVLVFVHELGHFLAAKLFGVKVLRFSLGFPPKLIGVRWGETEYCLSWIPLGGYVSLLGEHDQTEVTPEERGRALTSQPLPRRMAIYVAGPLANLLLPLALYWGLFVGEHQVGGTTLGYVRPDSVAWAAGMRPGDRLLAVEGEAIQYWDQLHRAITTSGREQLSILLLRDGQSLTVTVRPQPVREKDEFGQVARRPKIGISSNYQAPVVAVEDRLAPAWRAGLRTGDLVTAAAGRPIATWYELRAAIASAHFPLELDVERAAPAGADGGTDGARAGARPEGARRSGAESEGQGEPATPASSAARAGGHPAPLALRLRIDAATDLPPGYPLAWSGAEPAGGYIGLGAAEATVAAVEPGTPAAQIGLLPGDRILSVDETPIGFWEIDLASIEALGDQHAFAIRYLRGREVAEARLALKRSEVVDELHMKREEHRFGASNYTGLVRTHTVVHAFGPLAALAMAAGTVVDLTVLNGQAIWRMIRGDLPLDTVGGPIMLFKIAGQAARMGPEVYVRAIALVSIGLGVLNLLPIPVLDGGHLVLMTVEGLRRRPISLRARSVWTLSGLAILLAIMALAFRNDILRYFLS